MKKKKFLIILALLCTIAQGAWAQNYDVWDGHSEKKRAVAITCTMLPYILTRLLNWPG